MEHLGLKVWVVVRTNMELDRPYVGVHTNPKAAYEDILKYISEDDAEAKLMDAGKLKEAAELFLSQNDFESRTDLYETTI